MTSQHIDLGLTDVSAPAGGGCCGGGACGCGSHGAAHASTGAAGTQTIEVAVEGMTCEHCVRAVTEEFAAFAQVTGVDVNLAPGARSTVTVHTTAPLDSTSIRAAVEDAGYTLASA